MAGQEVRTQVLPAARVTGLSGWRLAVGGWEQPWRHAALGWDVITISSSRIRALRSSSIIPSALAWAVRYAVPVGFNPRGLSLTPELAYNKPEQGQQGERRKPEYPQPPMGSRGSGYDTSALSL